MQNNALMSVKKVSNINLLNNFIMNTIWLIQEDVLDYSTYTRYGAFTSKEKCEQYIKENFCEEQIRECGLYALEVKLND